MNLENNYLLKKLLKWANKKQNNYNIYNVVSFFKKNKEKNLEISLFTKNPWWYDLRFLRYRAWRAEIGNFRSFFALLLPFKTQKIKILKKWKKLAHTYVVA